MPDPTAAFWCRIPSRANFGDALTPWLIQRLTGVYPKFREPSDPAHKYLVTGSIIGLASAPCTVWGAGIMHARETIGRGLHVCAVRGPLTRERFIASGLDCPAVYGDPALVLPRLYSPGVTEDDGIGLVLHFSDRPRLEGLLQAPEPFKLIDIQDPIERVIDQIASCALVASSSLHGLIVAHAYGRPATWIEFRPLPSGDGSKFRDYLQSIACDQARPTAVRPDRLSADRLWQDAIAPPADFDISPLMNACPFATNDATA